MIIIIYRSPTLSDLQAEAALALTKCQKIARRKLEAEKLRREIEEAQKKLNELNIKQMKEKSQEPTENFFWFGAYDKLMKSQNIKKIFSFFAENEGEISSLPLKLLGNSMKEQPIIIKDFEIYSNV